MAALPSSHNTTVSIEATAILSFLRWRLFPRPGISGKESKSRSESCEGPGSDLGRGGYLMFGHRPPNRVNPELNPEFGNWSTFGNWGLGRSSSAGGELAAAWAFGPIPTRRLGRSSPEDEELAASSFRLLLCEPYCGPSPASSLSEMKATATFLWSFRARSPVRPWLRFALSLSIRKDEGGVVADYADHVPGAIRGLVAAVDEGYKRKRGSSDGKLSA